MEGSSSISLLLKARSFFRVTGGRMRIADDLFGGATGESANSQVNRCFNSMGEYDHAQD
jgi:hypothetical protein